MAAMIAALASACAPAPDETWSALPLPSPAGTGSAEVHLATAPSGEIIMSWLEPLDDGVALRFSTLVDSEWSAPRLVAEGNSWFVNWADFPSVTPINDRLWAAHWLAKRPGGTYAYDVAIAVSTDAGNSWSEPVIPHMDGTLTEHGFVSLFPWQNGVGAIWLDGRNMGEDGHNSHANGSGKEASGMTLRSAVISENLSVAAGQLVDELVCDCCQTDVALSQSGPVAVYRDRTDDEIRDIYIARALEDRWQTGRALSDDGWLIDGCPVNGPAIDADGDKVAVAWFTAANDRPRVRLARSTDSGVSFSAPIDIDDDKPIGRVDVTLLKTGEAAVSWLRRDSDNKAEIVMRLVPKTAAPGPVTVIATTAQSRASGFPQMVRRGNDLVFGWTEVSGDSTRVRTALLRKL